MSKSIKVKIVDYVKKHPNHTAAQCATKLHTSKNYVYHVWGSKNKKVKKQKVQTREEIKFRKLTATLTVALNAYTELVKELRKN